MADSIISILIFGFIVIIVMLIAIFQRLGLILKNSDSIESQVSNIPDKLGDIADNTNIDYQRKKDADWRKM